MIIINDNSKRTFDLIRLAKDYNKLCHIENVDFNVKKIIDSSESEYESDSVDIVDNSEYQCNKIKCYVPKLNKNINLVKYDNEPVKMYSLTGNNTTESVIDTTESYISESECESEFEY
jgi:hypothetical protein